MTASAVPVSLSHLPPGTPWWIVGLVIAGLVLHIGGGLTGIVTGYSNLFTRKGEGLHRQLGLVFVGAMIVMGTVGAILSIPIQQPGNVAGGIMAAYLVTTGWLAARRADNTIGAIEKLGALTAFAAAGLFLTWGVQATLNGGHLYHYGSALYYVFGALLTSFALADVRMIARGGFAGTARITRHLWRMCAGLFVASGSFFLGQQKVMPAFIHGSPILVVLGVAPLGFMLFWLVWWRISQRRVARHATAG